MLSGDESGQKVMLLATEESQKSWHCSLEEEEENEEEEGGRRGVGA